MEKQGEFCVYKQKRYYLAFGDKEVFHLKSEDFLAHLSHFTGLNQLDTLLAKLVKSLDTYIRVKSKTEDMEVDFKVFSHYDQLKNELYIYNNKDIVYITKTSIKVVENGYNNVMFRKTEHSPWEFIKNVDTSTNYLQKLITSVSYSKSILPLEDIHLVFEYYVYSLFLPELFE
jgi:hypothetical protein